MSILKSMALALILVAICAAPALAEPEAGGAKPKIDLKAQATDWLTISVSIGVFLILLFVLSKVAWKPILEGLQKREDTIKKALDDAADANTQAKALIARYEDKLDKAREEGQAVLEAARKDAQTLRAQIETDARERADETVDRSKREVEQVFAKAWDDLVRDAADVATEAASRIIQQELTPDGHATIISGVVGELTARRRRHDGEGAGAEGNGAEGNGAGSDGAGSDAPGGGA